MIEQMYVTTEGRMFPDKLRAEVVEKNAFNDWLDKRQTIDLRKVMAHLSQTSLTGYEASFEFVKAAYHLEKGVRT